jgi:DNA-binding MarR family transcriptional regulator
MAFDEQAVTAVDDLLTLLPELAAALRDAGPHADARDRLPGPALTPRQMAAMVQLHVSVEQTMSDFAAGMGVSRATATEMIERLEDRGLVVRRHDEDDRRVIVVRLSEAAEAEASAVVGRRRYDLERALARVPGVEPETLVAFLRQLLDQLSRKGD